jgi:hypothetical protein
MLRVLRLVAPMLHPDFLLEVADYEQLLQGLRAKRAKMCMYVLEEGKKC